MRHPVDDPESDSDASRDRGLSGGPEEIICFPEVLGGRKVTSSYPGQSLLVAMH